MVDQGTDTGVALELPSVREVAPDEEGGPLARQGLNYQDEIATGFLITMLEETSIIEVHCETHDDITVIHQIDNTGLQHTEFVQVKAHHENKLWSVADLCKRINRIPGTSILEKSFSHDKFIHQSQFRIVTLFPVNAELRVLTFPKNGPGRETDGADLNALKKNVAKRLPDIKSPRGNTIDYWLETCVWEVRESERAVQANNLIRLIKLSHDAGHVLLYEQAELVLKDIRSMVRKAGAARWVPDRDKKIFRREDFVEWWLKRNQDILDGASAPSGGKLRKKMEHANIPSHLINLAVDLRREYASEVRKPLYMASDQKKLLQRRVEAELMDLGSRYLTGKLEDDPSCFHDRCIQKMKSLNEERPDNTENQLSFLEGCMYDIVDRCFFRFDRQA
ncbi:MAG: DUF4297 domain-containing protein [Proteobacteria bacterium]|nr:DUF4297 domain-containing protein [Pseudomonadota bacterium]MBU4381588.1 DUF4297 domain-containing protein [Pseudomonadota bacterium]MCG2766574.1 DUF4297 domain-containing protein [Desulfarculaceae bacterium]